MSCPHGNPIGGCDTCNEVDAAFEAGKRSALAEQPAQQQEPVAWATQMGQYAHIKWGAKRPGYPMVYEIPLYTSPPAQRKPLTNGEIYTAYITATNQTLRAQDERLAFAFARAIEAKLKERNT